MNTQHLKKIKDFQESKWTSSSYHLLLFVLLSVFGFLSYINAIHGPFLFDDRHNIIENRYIHIEKLSWESIHQVLTCYKLLNIEPRPISFISFSLNYYFHRLNPAGYHLVNIFIHITTGILLFLFIKNTLRLSSSFRPISNTATASLILNPSSNKLILLSFFTSLLWIVHPLNTASVTYIVQRMNSMASMFYLFSLICFIKGRSYQLFNKSKKHHTKPLMPIFWFIGCFFSGVLALGCKQSAVTLAIFLFLYEWFFFQDLKNIFLVRSLSWIIISFTIAIIDFIAFMRNYLVEWILSTGYDQWGFTIGQRVLTEFRVLAYYLSLIIFPSPRRLNLDYDYPLSYSLVNPPSTLVSILLIVILLITAIYIADKERVISFAILWFLGNLLIESSVIGIEIIYDHRLYLPSMFIILLLVMMIYRSLEFQWTAHIFICF
jgi:protein O-mannosyl-transferase